MTDDNSLEDQNKSPDIRVLCWDELSEEDKKRCNIKPLVIDGDYIMYDSINKSVIIHNCNCLPAVVQAALVEQFSIVLHYSVPNPLQIKKKIESILNNRAFW